MGIKIHHGPDGTFKTSGAIKDDILPIIKAGRTLVTNVRGFSRDKAVKVLGRKFVHKNFNVIFVDTEVKEGRDKLARFFHWAPKGAFFVIDEVQRIFKPKWTAKDIALLNYSSPEQAALDDRPEDMDTAWDMHRHHNWDFVFTTTTITKVRSEMRDMAKVAVRHTNVGIWRFYKTVEHPCDSRGTTKSSQGAVKAFNFVPKKIFSLYSSTKTGTFENTEPRTPVYKDPKVLGMVTCLVLFWTYLLSKPVPESIGGSGAKSIEKPVQSVGEVPQTNAGVLIKNSPVTSSNTNNINVPNEQPYQASALDNFLENSYITGSVYSTVEKLYTFASGSRMAFSSLDLSDYGYSVKWIKPCKANISRGEYSIYVYCSANNFIVRNVVNKSDNQRTNEELPHRSE